MTMAGKGARVLVTPTSDLGKILACMHGEFTYTDPIAIYHCGGVFVVELQRIVLISLEIQCITLNK
jgi:hypothetical protein